MRLIRSSCAQPAARLAFCAALSLAGLRATPAPVQEITLPPETARLLASAHPGYALASAFCATCHSVDYVRSQPPGLPRSYWQATVLKMQHTFGAPIPPDSVDAIVDYLVKTYGAEPAPAPRTPPAAPPPGR